MVSKSSFFVVACVLALSVGVLIWQKNKDSVADKSCPAFWDFASLHAAEGYDEGRSNEEYYAVSASLLDQKDLKYPSALNGSYDGRGGRDTITVSDQGYINLDAHRIINIEIFKAENSQSNIINILAPGLANAEDNKIVVIGDQKLDVVYLDGCLDWDDPQQIAGDFPALRFTAHDKTGKIGTVEVDQNLEVRFLSPQKIGAWAQNWDWKPKQVSPHQIKNTASSRTKKEHDLSVSDIRRKKRDKLASKEEDEIKSKENLQQALGERKSYVHKSCDFDQTSVQSAAQYFPVIAEGKFQSGKFKAEKIYKGYRSQEIVFDDNSFENAQPVADGSYLLLAEFKDGKAKFTGCSKLHSMNNLESDPSLAELLSELAVYAATAETKGNLNLEGIDFGEKGESRSLNYNELYKSTSEHLKSYNDYLYLMEITGKLIVDAAKLGKEIELKRQNRHFRPEEINSWSICAQKPDFYSIYLSQEIKDALSGLIREQGPGGSTYGPFLDIFRNAASDYAYGLLQLGEFEAASVALCPADNGPLYLEAALKANKPELVNGKMLGRVRILSDLDLSHLVLKKIDGELGEWENIDVSGTDLTNAEFNRAKFKNVNLQQAKLYWATYDCETEFPEGFDPVQNHMIFDGDGECAAKQQPSFNLDNVVVETYYSGRKNEYDESKLHIVNMTGGTARNATLGTVDCFRCKIVDSDFSGSQIALRISEGEIRNTSFRDADLRNSSFPQMDFTNVDFTGANLTDTHLRGIYYDSKTKWPEGFDPQAAGANKKPE